MLYVPKIFLRIFSDYLRMASFAFSPSSTEQTEKIVQDVIKNVKKMIDERIYSNDDVKKQKLLIQTALNSLYSECHKKGHWSQYVVLNFQSFIDHIFSPFYSAINDGKLLDLYKNLEKFLKDIRSA